MIQINDIEIDCVVKFGINTQREYKYDVNTIDGTRHTKFKKNRDKIKIEFSPRNELQFDLVENIVNGEYDTLKVAYPYNTNNYKTRKFIVDSVSYDLEKSLNGVNKFSNIELDCEEA